MKTIQIKKALPPIILLACALLVPIIFSGNRAYICQMLCTAMLYLVAVFGLNFVTGMSGQINIGMAGTFCLGAYTSALLTVKVGLSPWLALPAVILMGVLVGLILGYPSLRVKGIYLALTTIALTEIVRKVITNLSDLTGGSMGVKNIPDFSLFGFELNSPVRFYYFMVAVVTLLALLCNYIIHSKWGRAFFAVKDDDTAAESCGINITAIKLTAFTLSSIFGCLAGALFAHQQGYLNPTTFTLEMSFTFIIMMAFGGAGNVYGCIIGALSITVLPELLRFLGEYYKIVYSAIVLLIAIFVPGGVISIGKRLFSAGATRNTGHADGKRPQPPRPSKGA